MVYTRLKKGRIYEREEEEGEEEEEEVVEEGLLVDLTGSDVCAGKSR